MERFKKTVKDSFENLPIQLIKIFLYALSQTEISFLYTTYYLEFIKAVL